ncbi:hypothetical protein GCM10020220_099310 [Nonomuraea rubra]
MVAWTCDKGVRDGTRCTGGDAVHSGISHARGTPCPLGGGRPMIDYAGWRGRLTR